MTRTSARRMLRKVALTATVGALSAQLILGQNPQTPAQRDATKPPGTQQNQPIPPQARPVTPDPTAPPGTQRVSPSAPPGTNTAPAPGQAAPSTSVPSTTVQPGNQQTPPAAQGTPTPSDDLTQTPAEPNLPDLQARPVPPLPDLTRLGVTSDNQISLTLNDAIRRALENNNDIEVARDDVRFAETQLRSLQGVYDPIFSITPQYSKFIQSQQSSLSGATSAGTVSQTDFQVNPSVDKLFEKGGGSYSFFFNNNRRSTDSTFNTLNPVYSSSLGVTFTQPLLRDRSIDNNRRQIRIQKKRLQQTDADFRRRTIEVISQVQNAYWDLVFAIRDQENRIANLNLTRENLRRVEAQIAAGAAAPLARAEVQTELANRESDVLLASQQISVAENVLKQLILKDPNAPEWAAVLAPADSPSFDATPLNLNVAIAEARQNRPELQRLRLQQDINGIDIQFFKNQTKPRIDLVGTVATTGLSGGPVTTIDPGGALIGTDPLIDPNAFLFNSLNQTRLALGLSTLTSPIVPATTFTRAPSNLVGGYGRTVHNLFNFDTRNVVVGVTIQFPFKNRTAEANLAGARIQKNQLDASTRLTELQVETEVRNAAQAVETSRRRVLAARAARENAELQLQGEQRLYQVGRSTTFLLFQRENTLANARNAEIRAQTDYNKALADLQRATSTTLRSNNIIVESKNP